MFCTDVSSKNIPPLFLHYSPFSSSCETELPARKKPPCEWPLNSASETEPSSQTCALPPWLEIIFNGRSSMQLCDHYTANGTHRCPRKQAAQTSTDLSRESFACSHQCRRNTQQPAPLNQIKAWKQRSKKTSKSGENIVHCTAGNTRTRLPGLMVKGKYK